MKRSLWTSMMIAAIGVLIPLTQHRDVVRAALPTSLQASSSTSISTSPVSNFLQVTRAVALRRTPGYGKNQVVSEKPGTLLWVQSGGTYSWWHVLDQNGHEGYIVRNKTYASPPNAAGAVSDSMAWNQSTTALPPGTTWDSSVAPLTAPGAPWAKKFAAVMFVAQSKLGTPYRLYHNEDRGQVGFDCSNYAAYVYHHALGISMSGASQVQFHSIGWTVPTWEMRPGDLIIFENGAHVGIYIGNHEMIEEGGGLGKAGYLSVAPGSTWGDKITTVKRIF